MFKDIKEAIYWIETQTKFKPKTDLSRMKFAYNMLDLSFKDTKFIHVGGTNGKGSVCSYLTHIFLEMGLSVGTYTSPYLISFNERIRMNGLMINDEDLLVEINEIYTFNETFLKAYGEHLAFFELLTLMALSYYHKTKVDVIIMEVGLGGLLDATNVINCDVSLITNIGFDHMKQLGNTLESIASNKLGILKSKNHLISTVDKELYPYFISFMKDMDVTYRLINDLAYQVVSLNPVNYIYQHETYSVSLLGKHQILNSILAIEAALYVYPSIDMKTIQKGLKKAIWAGRLESIADQVYIDGAHNAHALSALSDSLSETFKDKNIHVLFSALGDKDIKAMLDIVKTFSSSIVITSFDDFRYKDLSEYTDQSIFYIKDFNEAFNQLYNKLTSNDILLITGSLHFVGYAKKMLSNQFKK
ncbi:bifunctional folylpolyglutamate synthase/dihydrofolate synthase [Mariniplasma anaerobium]|uniref:tetrahydrofolate synthase n=1 Tax=Mariniplasma anaerobium TaxID=2735436 RepID=A0A7U9TIR1_9MOLU|nr:folylpolyglutamate synthase/dihydrofolate synthase family protein [Mariniplasma anaerobium]BCR36057.1 bifunctional folylpolyglutamate synthase/dihydrofolate synthase [Mariniplasma anaerobium]